ncbi:MAG: DUF6526 family protein [Agriterribacter sp.]
MKQQYSNHVRYYIPHHFIFYPIAGVLLALCIRGAIYEPNRQLWLFMAILVTMITWLSFMMRQHYALICQNRIVRLEMRLRYYQLTQKRLEAIEDQLSFGQLAAVRFASDEEFVPLLEKAIREKLSPDEIKKAIKNWQPDYMRV